MVVAVGRLVTTTLPSPQVRPQDLIALNLALQRHRQPLARAHATTTLDLMADMCHRRAQQCTRMSYEYLKVDLDRSIGLSRFR